MLALSIAGLAASVSVARRVRHQLPHAAAQRPARPQGLLMARARHGLYWLTVVIGLPVILFAISGAWLNDRLEPLYGSWRSRCYRDRYISRDRLPAPELDERWKS